MTEHEREKLRAELEETIKQRKAKAKACVQKYRASLKEYEQKKASK